MFYQIKKKQQEDFKKFAYTVAHDVKEPLRTISTYAKLFSLRYKDKIDKEGQQYIDNIESASNKLQKLVNAIYEYSIAGVQNGYENVNMKDIIDDVKKYLKVLIENTCTEIIIDDSVNINLKCNPVQIGRLLQNLFTNSIKFYREKHNPVIRITAKNNEEEYVFCVEDNARGIDNIYKDKIFDMFYRIINKDEINGVGVGLSICKRIIESQGGKIWFDSEVGKGTKFYFSIPKNIKENCECEH